MGLNDCGGRMSSYDQGLASILNRTEVRFAIFQFGHELFVIPFDVSEIEVTIGPIAIAFSVFFLIEPSLKKIGLFTMVKSAFVI